MSKKTEYRETLAADAFRRFEKVVRADRVLDDLPVTELSDGELAFQLARQVDAKAK